jgi:outer membrane protein
MTMNATNGNIFYGTCQAGIIAASMFFGLMSAASETYGQEAGQQMRQRAELVIRKATGSEVYEKLLLDADALIKRGKPADAYALLEPLEFEHAGEERFDYLIGVAALDSGKPDKATLAFERVLAINPDFAAARMDMARAYYQLGDLLRAKTEFALTLKQNPTAAARLTIHKYLNEITAQEAGKRTHLAGYIEGTVGHDNNVNNSTNQAQIFVDVLGEYRTLYSANVKTPDNYYGVAAGGEVMHSLNASWRLYAAVDMSQRNYGTQNIFDSQDLEERAGVMFGAKTYQLRAGVLGGQYNLGDARNRDMTGYNADWFHAFSPSNQLNVYGQHTRYRFADVVMQPNDYDQQAIGIGWLHVTADGRSSLYSSLYLGTEKDVSTIITTATPNGGRIDGTKRFNGLRIGSQTLLNDNTTLFANAGMQAGDYSRVNYYFQRQRSDRLYDLAAGANWRWDSLWALRPQLSYSKNDSNIDIYGFDRMDVSLTVRRDFR